MNAILRRSGRAVTLACSVASATAVSAGAASAATVTLNRACYVNANPAVGAPMTVSGTGFSPGETVDVSGAGIATMKPTADAGGNFSQTVAAPVLATTHPATKKTKLTAVGEASHLTATVTVRSANLAIRINPRQVPNVRVDKVAFSFSGFTPGRHIYGFYRYGKHTVRTTFGVATGPCGTLTQRALLYPGGRPKHDNYSVAFESTSRFSTRAFPRVSGLFQILHF